MNAHAARVRPIAILLVTLGIASGCNGPRSPGSDGFTPARADRHTAAAREEKIRPANSGLSVVMLPSASSDAWMVSDGAGGEWTAKGNTLIRIDESTYAVSQYTLKSTNSIIPFTPGPIDHAMWFQSEASSLYGIGFVDLVLHKTVKYGLSERNINGIAAGPDDAMWLTYQDKDYKWRIGRLDLKTRKFSGYPTPGGREAFYITLGSDGGLWFIEESYPKGKLGRIDPYSHDISEYDIKIEANYLTSGSDGAIWFTLNDIYGGIGRLDLETHQITYYQTKGETAGYSTARDQDIWFTIWQSDIATRRIGRLSTRGGHFRKYLLPLKIFGLTRGSDDQLWAAGPDGAAKICPDLGLQACIGYHP